MNDRSRARRFHLAVVVGIVIDIALPNPVTGRMEHPRLLSHLTGLLLVDYQHKRALTVAVPYLRETFPWTATLTPPAPVQASTREGRAEWLAPLVAEHGEYLDVPPFPEGLYEVRDMYDEWNEVTGGAPLRAAVPGWSEPRLIDRPGMIANPPYEGP